MLTTFSTLVPYVKFNQNRVSIDNFCFKLHYRYTFVILIIATILVTSRQYIGEHIKCISGTIPERVINTFCFVTTTFTVVRHLDKSALDSGAIFQPGIGPYQSEEDSIKRHAYYQWVPFVLFGQALCFMVSHTLWKHWEGGHIQSLAVGLKMIGLSKYIHEQNLKSGSIKMISCEKVEERAMEIRREILNRFNLNRQWGNYLVIAECLNLVNIVLQIYLTNKFLAGQFLSLGWKVLDEKWSSKMDILDAVFPKVTKCHFYKYGASGSLQTHDTLCVMALNIVNEKIYTILWFWFFFVLIMSCVAIIWRLFTLFVFKNKRFTEVAFSQAKPGRRFNRKQLHVIISRCKFSDWMFLYFIADNVSEFLFNKVITHLADELSPNSRQDEGRYEAKRIESQPDLSYRTPLDMVDSPLLLTGNENQGDTVEKTE